MAGPHMKVSITVSRTCYGDVDFVTGLALRGRRRSRKRASYFQPPRQSRRSGHYPCRRAAAPLGHMPAPRKQKFGQGSTHITRCLNIMYSISYM